MDMEKHPHTSISREIIKPSLPTPSHLKTYNLSLFDRIAVREYMPLVLFYPNHGRNHPTGRQELARVLKNSLSEVLSRYYPLAGTFDTVGGAHVDCDDKGVDFLEAYSEGRFADCVRCFEYGTLDGLFPDGLVWGSNRDQDPNHHLLAIQLNHFTRGGTALALSMSHKIGDASTLCNFVKYWADVARYQQQSSDHDQTVPVGPCFLASNRLDLPLPEFVPNKGKNCITRKFIFPNYKVNDLKVKVMAMAAKTGIDIKNPTRLEVLTALLYKHAIQAAATNCGTFEPSTLIQAINMRKIMMEPLPETCVGNISSSSQVTTRDASEVTLETLVSRLQMGKMELGGLKNWEVATEKASATLSTNWHEKNPLLVPGKKYIFTGTCNFPMYKVDFGWGVPIRATAPDLPIQNRFLFMDTPTGDGIEVYASLEKEDMAVLKMTKNSLSFPAITIENRFPGVMHQYPCPGCEFCGS